MSIKTFPKGTREKVAANFLAHEFDCPCEFPECKETLINEELPRLLQAMRDEMHCRIDITNGYRCQAYQDDLAKRGYETATKSMHLEGGAADISSRKHKGYELEEIARAAGFKAVGVGKTFIHCDVRNDKERRWGYKAR